jgi:glycerol-3-phosphate dehydrogenase
LNYVVAESLLRDAGNQVNGALLRDSADPDRPAAQVRARVVINATGAWADGLRGQIGEVGHIRPLRGSHLIFPAWKLPVAQAISFLHPRDRRPVFIFPWEGITLVGTTDVDHDTPLDEEPGISPAEFVYLMEAVKSQFSSLDLTREDVLTTFAGVRPVIGTGKADPSKESRDHVLWEEQGLLTVTGGKLTTFRLIALDALKAARERLPDMPKVDRKQPVLDPVDLRLPDAAIPDEETRRRLLGRYGADAPALIDAAAADELEPVPGTKALWAELRWAARAEGVVHLDDLLLRRVRLGLLTTEGGLPIMERIRSIVQPELGWDDARWEQEVGRYAELWRNCYSVPEGVPDTVTEPLSGVQESMRASLQRPGSRQRRQRWEPGVDETRPAYRRYLGIALVLALVFGALLMRRRNAPVHD